MHTRLFMLDLGSKRDLPVVLLIDDDMVSREVAATVLIMGGYTVHTLAESGEGLFAVAGPAAGSNLK